jgi:prepilin-type processing-associated H-X9-DG protein
MKHRAILASVVLAFCAVVGFQKADLSTPEATVNSFVAALSAADFSAAARCVKGGKPDANFSEITKQFKQSPFTVSVEDLKVKVNGDKADATYVLVITSQGGKSEKSPEPDTIQLERIDSNWLIVPADSPTSRSPLGGIAKLTTDPEMVTRQMKGSAQAAVCMSNLKQLCTGFMMLAADNDDVFKVKADSWKKAVMLYIKNEKIFFCPSDKSGAVSYSINPAMVGKSQTAVELVAETVLLYEGKKGKLDFRHEGRAAVGFADGHVRLVNQEEAKKLRWKP